MVSLALADLELSEVMGDLDITLHLDALIDLSEVISHKI